jgi:hypothetical protein
LEVIADRLTCQNTGNGAVYSFQLIRKFIWWGCRLSAGLCGKHATWCVLRGNVSDLLLRSSVLASSLISYWAGLQKDDAKEILETGAEMLKNAALTFHSQMVHQDDHGAGMVALQ